MVLLWWLPLEHDAQLVRAKDCKFLCHCLVSSLECQQVGAGVQVKDNNLNPVWQPIEVDIRQLCNADGARPLRMEVSESAGARETVA